MKSKTIKKPFAIFWILFFPISQCLFAQKFDWAKQLGGNGMMMSGSGHSIALDASGNIYTTGAFFGTADFDPGTGIFNMVSQGTWNVFISKFDSSGNFIWAKQIGGMSAGLNSRYSLAPDPFGNVCVVGSFEGTADFDPGTGIFNLTSAGDKDIFVCKLDASGNFMWAKQLGGSSSDICKSIALDTFGVIYLTGSFEDTADFDPGTGIFSLISSGSTDAFLCKLNASGNFIWAKQFANLSLCSGNSIAFDAVGNVYSTGDFRGTADFDPGVGTFNLTAVGTSANVQNIFVSKLDPSGNFIWAKQFEGGNPWYGSNSIALDKSGNVYTTGCFRGTVDFDPAPEVFNLTAAGVVNDVFVSKLDSLGKFIWAKHWGGGSYDNSFSIAVGASGDVYTTGTFIYTVDFDPGPGSFNLTTAGTVDAFISKLDPSGNFVWAKQFAAAQTECMGNTIALDALGNIYTAGSFANTVDFDPDAGVFNLTGGKDIFVHKLNTSNSTGITEKSKNDFILVYPNPTSGSLAIDLGKIYPKVRVVIRNISGQVLSTYSFVEANKAIFQVNEPPGVYFAEIYSDGKRLTTARILKE